MAYQSVDILQKELVTDVFTHLKDPKKATGRALGTIVEIITYYLLKTWGFIDNLYIEKSLIEYGNDTISHNVEFSLHPVASKHIIKLDRNSVFTSNQILKTLENSDVCIKEFYKVQRKLFDNGDVRNACLIAENKEKSLLCNIDSVQASSYILNICEQFNRPFSIFECKRVGVEEGNKKGPQTIEKAKQGAYVAKAASSLQKIRDNHGKLNGIIYKSDGSYEIGPFYKLLDKILDSNEKELLQYFIMTVGVVSNHGNWFTSDNQNKEMKVLAQSYDWLLFLTDYGLTRFVEDLIIKPIKRYDAIRRTFLSSYKHDKRKNHFTKVQMNIESDQLLQEYFKQNLPSIEEWFNVISPKEKTLGMLKNDIYKLSIKDWSKILK